MDSVSSYDPSAYRTDTCELLGPYQQHVSPVEKGYSQQDTLESLAPATSRSSGVVKIAKRGLLVAGVAVAASGAIYGLGRMLHSASDVLRAGAELRSDRIGLVASVAGRVIGWVAVVAEQGGRVVFLAITVPPYILLYQLPRWFILEKFPIALTMMQQWGESLREIASWLLKNVAHRAADVISRVWISTTHVAEQLRLTVQTLAKPVIESVAVALTKAQQVMSTVTQVAARFIWHAASAIVDLSAKVFDQINDINQWLSKHIYDSRVVREFMRITTTTLTVARAGIQKLGNTLKLATDGVAKLCRMTAFVADTVGDYLLKGLKLVNDHVAAAANASALIISKTAQVFVAWMTPAAKYIWGRLEKTSLAVIFAAKQVINIFAAAYTMAAKTLVFIAKASKVASAAFAKFIIPPLKTLAQMLANAVEILGKRLWNGMIRLTVGLSKLWNSLNETVQIARGALGKFARYCKTRVVRKAHA